MDKDKLLNTTKALLVKSKGILAADESTRTCKKRFDSVGIEFTEENRRKYRELLFTTPEMEEYISGVILFDETIRQSTGDGKPFPELLKERGIVPGIKVDIGKVEMPFSGGEMITEGLDGLRGRLKEYYELGARFAKWRAAIKIGDQIPSAACIVSNTNQLARYANFCHEAGLVPIVEPEILMDGDHDSTRCADVTTRTIKTFVAQAFEHKVFLDAVIIKTNMVLPGKDSGIEKTDEDVAKETVSVLNDSVSVAIPGVVFLSGGQNPEESTSRLTEIAKIGSKSWELSFSYGRALQEPALTRGQGMTKSGKKRNQLF